MNIQSSELSICEYISAGAYDATSEDRNCISPNMTPVPQYCPTPLSLEVHAALNYQPKMWTSNCKHFSKYAVDFDGNIFYVSHNEACLGDAINGEQCFVYKPSRDHLEDITTGIDPFTLNMVSSGSRCVARDFAVLRNDGKKYQKRRSDDLTCPLAKRRKVELYNFNEDSIDL